MTITALPSRDEYTSSAGQTVFNYSFKIYESSNLDVYVTPAGQMANDAADLTTAYVVDPNTIGNPTGGLITFNSPLSNGDLVTIVSSVPYDRTVDYQVNGDFLPTTVNGDNDRQVSQIKQVLTRANRTLTYPQSLQGAISLTLPNPESGLFLKWKTDLTGLENTDVDADFLAITGGTMAGDINMGGYNIVNIGNGFLPLSGGTMTGSINMGDNDISNIDLLVADRAVIGGSAIIPGGDFTITIAEQVTLTDGQVVVVFLADTAGATFYVNGLSVDSGLIIEDLDYQIDNVTKTMTLVNSYPAGTILTMRYFDGDSGIAPTAYDSVAAMKSTVLPIGKLVTTKGYYTAGDGGGADYLVAASQAVDGYGDHVLANGNVVLLQVSSTVNTRTYGLVGDGVTDDTLAGQALVDRLSGIGGGTVLFSTTASNTYRLNLSLPSAINLKGGSRSSTLIPAIDDAIIKLNQGENVVRVKLQQLILDGSATKGSFTSQDGFLIQPNATYFHDSITVEDCRITDCGRRGVSVIGLVSASQFVQGLSVKRTKIIDCTKSGLYMAGHVIESYFEKLTIKNNGSDSIDADSNLTITQNSGSRPGRLKFQSCVINVPAYTGGYAVAIIGGTQVTFDNCDFEEFINLIKLDNALTSNIAVRDCRVTAPAGITAIVLIRDVNGFVWDNNEVTENTTGAVGIDFDTLSTRIVNVDVRSNNDWGGLTLPTTIPPSNVLASDVLTLSNRAGVVTVSGEGGNLDDLSTINDEKGGTTQLKHGDTIVLISASNGDDITVKDGIGNIQLAGGDFVLTRREDTLSLMWSQGLALWLEVSRSDNVT